MILNLHYVGDGLNRFTLHSGDNFAAIVRKNDRVNSVLWLEVDEGAFTPLPYSEIHHASRPCRPSGRYSMAPVITADRRGEC